MQNHSDIAEFLWKIADLIKDDYEAKAYEDVILPCTLLRRLDCVLEPTRAAVRKAAVTYQTAPENTRDALLKKAAGQPFYNTSEYSLIDLLKFPNDIGANFAAYLAGFSANVKDILFNFSGGEEKGLSAIYDTLQRKRLLFKITKAFAEADLSPATVDNHGMGTIFEYLIRKFKEASNEAAGQFYTPRDIISLMVKLVFEPDRAKLAKEKLLAIYDPACGTGGMLTIAKEYLLAAINPDLEIYLYGQEINEKTYAVAKADMLMKGENPENIKRENTLSHDLLPGKQFNYMLSNPPFGKDWKNIREEIEAEHRLGATGRYGPGLPDVGDGAMLFLLHKLSKFTAHGSKLAIIFNGSPLFNGDAGSGPSNIRRYLLEKDLLDAIVALPVDLFYNTGIATYIWLIHNRKPEVRRGKVQLIDASGPQFAIQLRRNLGKKRYEIGEDQATSILGIYEAFAETKVSKIFDTTDFGYTKVCVERPLRLRYDLQIEQLRTLWLDPVMLKMKEDRLLAFETALHTLAKQAPWQDDAAFCTALGKCLPFALTTAHLKLLRSTLGLRDENAEPVYAEPGSAPAPGAVSRALAGNISSTGAATLSQKRAASQNGDEFSARARKTAGEGARAPQADPELRDFENVPLKDEIDAYFQREVLPHVPDAWMDRSKDKIGYEISFTKYFYEYTPLRTTAEIAAELLQLDEETENLLREVVKA